MAILTQPFDGFPAGTFSFLRGLAAHNQKAWFDEHRDDYDAFYVAPAKALVEALGPRLRKISPTVQYEPRFNASLMRINRDVRFSKDKSPYKTHLDLWFWEGEHRGWDAPGFYFRMFPGRLMLGTGMHYFERHALDAYRAAVLDPKLGPALEKTLAKVRAAGPYEIGNVTRKKVPRGFDPEHPRAKLLLHEGLSAGIEGPVPKDAGSPKFVEWCARHYAKLAPINGWLKKAVVGR